MTGVLGGYSLTFLSHDWSEMLLIQARNLEVGRTGIINLSKRAQRRLPCLVVAREKTIRIASNLQEDDQDEIPFSSMQEWLVNKPRGFGNGKSYDTSLEEKLLEELERNKTAQATALSRKEKIANTKKENQIKIKKTEKENISELPSRGVKVWMGNLPKKKNIERDLQAKFQNVPGLLRIEPVVIGNEKTRDPICKGFSFLTFSDKASAETFMTVFQGESITFGKVEKKPVYQLANGTISSTTNVVPMDFTTKMEAPRLRVRDKTAALFVKNTTDVIVMSSSHGAASEEMLESHPEISPMGMSVDHVLNNALDSPANTTIRKDGIAPGDEDMPQANDNQLQGGSCINGWLDNTEQEYHLSDSKLKFPEERNGFVTEGGEGGMEDQSSSVSEVPGSIVCADQGLTNGFDIASDIDLRQTNVVSSLHVSENTNKRIHEPESNLNKLEQLQKSSLSDQTTGSQLVLEDEILQLKEEQIKELEKRVFQQFKTNIGVQSKDRNVGKGRKEKPNRAAQKLKNSKARAATNLGSASRLKKKERDFIMGAISKYGNATTNAN